MSIVKYVIDAYQQFQEKDLSVKIFQFFLFIWVVFHTTKKLYLSNKYCPTNYTFFRHFFYHKQKNILIEVLSTYKKLFIVLSLFIVSMSLSTLLGISEKGTLTEILKYIFRYIFILITILYFYKQSFFSKKWLFTMILIVLFVHSLDGIYQYITGFDLILNKPPDKPSYMLTGAVYHHNPFGLFMAIGAIISITLFLENKKYTIFKYEKIIFLISLFIFFFTLFYSQSRSAWVMFGIYFVGYMFVYITEMV